MFSDFYNNADFSVLANFDFTYLHIVFKYCGAKKHRLL